MIHPIFVQTIYYFVVMLLVLIAMGFLQMGFFWKYFKVKLSFGKLVLVKIRSLNRDHFAVGKIIEGTLQFSQDKENKTIAIKDRNVFYKSVGVSWVDLDEEKNALGKTDYSPVEGYDAIKFNNLLERALTKPTLLDDKERKIMLFLLIVTAIASIVGAYLIYKQSADIGLLKATADSIPRIVEQSIQRTPI